MKIKINDSMKGKLKLKEIEKQFITYAYYKCCESIEKVSEFTGLTIKKVDELIKKYEISPLASIKRWIEDKIPMFKYMPIEQQNDLMDTIKLNFSDLLFERKKLNEIYKTKKGRKSKRDK